MKASSSSLPVDSGLWEICMEKGADSPTLRFYQNIYTNIYPYNRGVLVFYVNPYDFFDSFYAQVQCPFYFSDFGRFLYWLQQRSIYSI